MHVLAVKKKITGDVAILTISGKLMGGGETTDVHDNVKSLLTDGMKKFVIDISKIKWLNSSGLGMLISCLTSIRNAEGVLKIVGATERVNTLFMMTQLITVFETYDTVDQAVATL